VQYRDRGAVDVSVQLLFGVMCVLLVMGLLFETTAYWHARNVFAEAAAEGARVAAAFDGSCAGGVMAAQQWVDQRAGSWGRGAVVTCALADNAATAVVTVRGRTPGLLGPALGFEATVRDSAPRER
jgi:NOL1/NOP2/fmu family ribosome biogenesis protein